MSLLLLTTRPAHAQMSGGYWTVQDPSGNPVTQNPDGSYTLMGTMKGSATDGYPGLLALAQAQPSGSQAPYVSAFSPNELGGSYTFLYNGTSGSAPYPSGLYLSASAANADIFNSTSYPWIGAFLMPAGIALSNAPCSSNTMPPPLTYVNGNVSANANSTLTVVWKWVPYTMQGGTPAPPPATLSLLVSAPVTAGVSPSYGNSGQSSGLTGSATASNGLGDSVNVMETSTPPSQSLPGKHIVQLPVDPTTGQVTVPVPGQVSTSATNSVPFGHVNYYGTSYFAYISNNGYTNNSPNGYTTVGSSASVGATAQQDNRAVSISTTLGQTYHKSLTRFDTQGIALKDPNVVDANNALTDDTVKSPGPGTTVNVTYTAHVTGTWGKTNPEVDASYLWNLNYGAGNAAPSGTFSLPYDPPYDYFGQFDSKVTGQAHCYLHLTDVDGANATANHYINWHDPVENWKTSGTNFADTPTPYGSSNGSQPANGFVNISVPPGRIECGAGPAVGEFIAFSAHVAEAIDAPVDPLVLALMLTTSYSMGFGDPPPSPTIYPVQGTESQFQNDVATQEGITNGAYMPNAVRMDQALADSVYTSGNYVGYFNGGTQGSGGPQGSLTFNATAYQLRWRQNYLGDGYDNHGYTGSVPGYVSWPGSIQYVFTWAWSAASGNPGG